MAKPGSEGMSFTDYYAEASCAAGQGASFNMEAVKEQIQRALQSHAGQ